MSNNPCTAFKRHLITEEGLFVGGSPGSRLSCWGPNSGERLGALWTPSPLGLRSQGRDLKPLDRGRAPSLVSTTSPLVLRSSFTAWWWKNGGRHETRSTSCWRFKMTEPHRRWSSLEASRRSIGTKCCKNGIADLSEVRSSETLSLCPQLSVHSVFYQAHIGGVQTSPRQQCCLGFITDKWPVV